MSHRRSKEKARPTVMQGPIVEDDHVKKLSKAYIGTFLIDVRCLDPHWVDAKIPNREINEVIMNGLLASFTAGIRRTAIADRMKATCDRGDLFSAIDHLAERELARLGIEVTEDHMVNQRNEILGKAKEGSPDNLSQISWPAKKGPSLDAGQHRRAALITANNKAKELNRDADSKGIDRPLPEIKDEVSCIFLLTRVRILLMFLLKDYYWAVEFYDTSKVSGDTLMKLRANGHNLSQPNSDGLMYLQAVTEIYDPKKPRNMTTEALRCWLQQIIGIGEAMCPRAMAIIRNDVFRESLSKFTSTAYGQKHFQWSPMEKITNSKFNTVC